MITRDQTQSNGGLLCDNSAESPPNPRISPVPGEGPTQHDQPPSFDRLQREMDELILPGPDRFPPEQVDGYLRGEDNFPQLPQPEINPRVRQFLEYEGGERAPIEPGNNPREVAEGLRAAPRYSRSIKELMRDWNISPDSAGRPTTPSLKTAREFLCERKGEVSEPTDSTRPASRPRTVRELTDDAQSDSSPSEPRGEQPRRKAKVTEGVDRRVSLPQSDRLGRAERFLRGHPSAEREPAVAQEPSLPSLADAHFPPQSMAQSFDQLSSPVREAAEGLWRGFDSKRGDKTLEVFDKLSYKQLSELQDFYSALRYQVTPGLVDAVDARRAALAYELGSRARAQSHLGAIFEAYREAGTEGEFSAREVRLAMERSFRGYNESERTEKEMVRQMERVIDSIYQERSPRFVEGVREILQEKK